MTLRFNGIPNGYAIGPFVSGVGNIRPGTRLRFYNTGGTTPRAIYSDTGLTTAITQPIVADSAGIFRTDGNGNAVNDIFLQSGLYKLRWETSAGAEILTWDNVDPGLATGGSGGVLGVAEGGTGATTASGALANLGAAPQSGLDSEIGERQALDDRVEDLEDLSTLIAPAGAGQISNANFVLSVASKILTIALKTKAGTDPSISDPVVIGFRSATAASGNFELRTVTGALSLAVPSTATLGFANAEANLIHFGFLDNDGTVELAVSKDGSVWNEDRVASSTAIDTSADSAVVIYSTSARSSKAIRLAGVALITTGATAGEWDNAPTRVSQVAFNPLNPFKNTNKSWLNYDAATTGAAVARDSFNVSSITDGGTGVYAVNFAVALRNRNYACPMSAKGTPAIIGVRAGVDPTASALTIETTLTDGTGTDRVENSVTVTQ